MNQFFVTVPHSGEEIPDAADWLKGLPEPILMCDVDRFVDQLYRDAIGRLKIPAVFAKWHRYVVDLNRLPEDIDASTVRGNATASGQFSRGFHWQHTTIKDVLMPKPMSAELHAQFVKLYFDPFHAEIRRIMVELGATAGSRIYHLDLHSMPSLGTAEHRDPGEQRKDIVISDNLGRSSSPTFKDFVIKTFTEKGFSINYNWPYYGGRITETYGHPDQNHHSIQVELNRRLYMNEQTKQAERALWPDLQARLGQALQEIQHHVLNSPGPV